MHIIYRFFWIYLITFQLIIWPVATMADNKKTKTVSKGNYDLRELALPSEVESIGKAAGAVYYSPSVKDKVLIPVHFWGEIVRSGLHFIPNETTLVKGISMAGGPRTQGILDNVKLTRVVNGKFTQTSFDLSEGGDEEANTFKLRPGDTVFIEQSHYYENRTYITSLIGVFATLLSAILLYRQVERD